MRRIFVPLGVLVLAAVLTTAVFAGGNANVYATFSVISQGHTLNQRISGGGPLFADGSMGGKLTLTGFNGTQIAHFHGKEWLEDPQGVVAICWDRHDIKFLFGTSPTLCQFGIPVSGTPVPIDFDSDGVPDGLIRLTLTN